MTALELDNLISKLTSWCKAKHGTPRKIAARLGASAQLFLTDWRDEDANAAALAAVSGTPEKAGKVKK